MAELIKILKLFLNYDIIYQRCDKEVQTPGCGIRPGVVFDFTGKSEGQNLPGQSLLRQVLGYHRELDALA